MRNLFILLAIISFAACTPVAKEKKEPSAQDHLVMSVLWYQRAGEMRALYHQGFNLAKMQLDKHLANYKGEKIPAVVVDIDETMLNNSPFEGKAIETGVGYTSETWKRWTSQGTAKALPGALDFAKYVKSKGADIIYISNRKVDEQKVTLENLKAEGFPNASDEFIHLRSETSSKEVRRNKVSETHEILMLIGDNLTDFAEVFEHKGEDFGFSLVEKYKNEFGNRFIVLPNPMYGEWEKLVYNDTYKLSDEEKYKLRKEKVISYDPK